LFFEVEGLENFGSTKVSPELDARLADALDGAMILPVQDVTLRMEFSSGKYRAHRPHPEEAALLARPSRRMAAGTASPVAVLRDARKNALLRTRLKDDIDMIRTSETRY